MNVMMKLKAEGDELTAGVPDARIWLSDILLWAVKPGPAKTGMMVVVLCENKGAGCGW